MRVPLSLLLCALAALHAEPAPVVTDVELQPLAAQARRVFEAAEFLGEPFSAAQREALDAAARLPDRAEAVAKIQALLDARVLFVVNINPEMRVKAAQGPAKAVAVEQGWRLFLVKVVNEAGVTAPLRIRSPQAQALYNSVGITAGKKPQPAGEPPFAERWTDIELFTKSPMKAALSGLGVEYALVSIFSRDAGKREARFSFDVGQGTQDLGFRNDGERALRLPPGARGHAPRARRTRRADAPRPFSSATRRSACIPRRRNASRRTSAFIRRSIARTARRCGCRTGNTTIDVPARPGVHRRDARRHHFRRHTRDCRFR